MSYELVKDELLIAIEKYRRRSIVIRFLKNPIEVIREKPIFIIIFSGLFAVLSVYSLTAYLKIRLYDALLLSFVIAIAPPGLFDYYEKKRIKRVESYFPNLLTDLALSIKAGMSINDAIKIAARGEYGVLTEGVKWIERMMSWGLSFEEALQRFANKYPTPLIKRSISIIVEASKAGGKISDIIEIVAESAREIKMLEKKRSTGAFPYLTICYIAFLVFVGIILVLAHKYIPMLETLAAKSQTAPEVTQVVITSQTVEMYKMLFYHALLMQGIFNGLVAGKLGEGYIVAGFKHAIVLAAIATLAYFMFIM